jgi:hypothetical protein
MKVVLLRVGIDKGSGGIYGPLFQDDSFEFIYIPDKHSADKRTYGTIKGKRGDPLIEYFPQSRRHVMINQAVHVDPEFTTFTYGDPTILKSKLRTLKQGDLLTFYCGLKGWNCKSEAALYLVGYFEILTAGKAIDYSKHDLQRLFGENFHVRHKSIYDEQKSNLVLVKGSENSRLFKKAVRISDTGYDRARRPVHILSPKKQEIFGDFNGKVCIQRAAPRWVRPEFVAQAAQFIKSRE